MAFVVGTGGWIEVVPVLVVHRDSPLGRVLVVHVVVAALGRLEIVGIVHVRVVVEPVPVGGLTITSSLCFCRIRQSQQTGEQDQSCQRESSQHSLAPLLGVIRRERTPSRSRSISKKSRRVRHPCQPELHSTIRRLPGRIVLSEDVADSSVEPSLARSIDVRTSEVRGGCRTHLICIFHRCRHRQHNRESRKNRSNRY